jgi:hypothetical protein
MATQSRLDTLEEDQLVRIGNRISYISHQANGYIAKTKRLHDENVANIREFVYHIYEGRHMFKGAKR